ncbi:MAG: FAD-dependent oxidoreductase [Burkholderiales bacterium]|nr:FAD-dependent oxidoreductase [Burkholderiales bacterium]
MDRRAFLQAVAAAPIAGLPHLARADVRPRVVVIGGGFGGGTAAKYLRLWDPGIEVLLIERQPRFISCPMSNLVLSGDRRLDDNVFDYSGLERHGVVRVQAEVDAIDADKREVRTADGARIRYDRLVLSPGIDFRWGDIQGLDAADADREIPHAWKAGPQTELLRRQLAAMPDGGVYLLSIPKSPYRCPPGPYERISLIASYFKREKPRSKVLVVDANPEIVSKKGLFTQAWADLYPGLIEYVPGNAIVEVDVRRKTARTDFDGFRADVLNIVPPHGAGTIAHRAGVVSVDGRWAGVDFQTYESLVVPGIHVLGDATSAGPAPKSAHTANNQAKIAASAIIALLRGKPPTAVPVSANTCYSFVSPEEAVHIAAVYRFDPAKKTLVTAEGTLGVSKERNTLEAGYTYAWAENIWRDTLF